MPIGLKTPNALHQAFCFSWPCEVALCCRFAPLTVLLRGLCRECARQVPTCSGRHRSSTVHYHNTSLASAGPALASANNRSTPTPWIPNHRLRLSLAEDLLRTRDRALRQLIHQQLADVSNTLDLPVPKPDNLGHSARATGYRAAVLASSGVLGLKMSELQPCPYGEPTGSKPSRTGPPADRARPPTKLRQCTAPGAMAEQFAALQEQKPRDEQPTSKSLRC